MRVAVVSDIHANLAALEAVLAAVDTSAPDEIWCLGDLVGYGARPNECCALVRERATVCLAGNHDLAVRGTIVDLSSTRWLLNPGSVGQPRDGDPRAAYLVLDLGASTATFERVDYDIERTQSEIRAAGLPDTLAERLAYGQ